MNLTYQGRCNFSAARNGLYPRISPNPFRGWHGHDFRLSATLADKFTTNSENTLKTLFKDKLSSLKSKIHGTILNEFCPTTEPSDLNLLNNLKSLPEAGDFFELRLESRPHFSCRTNHAESIISCGRNLESAHFLPMVPEGHKCSRLHGHSFFVSIDCLTGKEISDYNNLSRPFFPLLEKLDGCLLNELKGLENPTSENLARYIFDKLQIELPGLLSVTVFETRSAGSTYYGQNNWECFKDFEFDSARPSERNFEGHTYFIRLSVRGNISEKAGWILDFADIKAGFKPFYKELDHHLLSEINGLDLSSLKALSTWVFQKLKPQIPLLHSVTIRETDCFSLCLKES